MSEFAKEPLPRPRPKTAKPFGTTSILMYSAEFGQLALLLSRYRGKGIITPFIGIDEERAPWGQLQVCQLHECPYGTYASRVLVLALRIEDPELGEDRLMVWTADDVSTDELEIISNFFPIPVEFQSHDGYRIPPPP